MSQFLWVAHDVEKQRVDSNHQPSAYEADTLPIAPLCIEAGGGFEPPTSGL